MSSVTKRITKIKQPRGGFIKPSDFEIIDMNDGEVLNEEENIHGSLVGLAVDYLTRYNMGTKITDAFKIPLKGAERAELMGKSDFVKTAKRLIKKIKGIDDVSIVNACKLVTFDAWFRNPFGAAVAKSYDEIEPDKATIQNIHTLVKRSMTFFEKYGPITYDGFTFEPPNSDSSVIEQWIKNREGTYGGYTLAVDSGDGDFLTKDTLWDFKVSKSKPTSKNTLQILMYWIMGQHSGQDKYKEITKIGIFNPRLNLVYLLDIAKIPESVIKAVEKDVICYD